LSHAPGEVADPRSDVGDHIALLESDSIQRRARRFFCLALRSHQPVSPAYAHHGSDLAAGSRMRALCHSGGVVDGKQQKQHPSWVHTYRIAVEALQVAAPAERRIWPRTRAPRPQPSSRGFSATAGLSTTWKDADPDPDILKEAKAEYAKLWDRRP